MGAAAAINPVAAIGTGAQIAGSYLQAKATKDAAKMQRDSAQGAQDLQYKMFQEQNALMEPWRSAGEQNLDRLQDASQVGGYLDYSKPYTTEQWKQSPEYQVYNRARDAAAHQSTNALLGQAAAEGMYGSGNMANQLTTNLGNLYAQYDPASLAAAQNSRLQSYNVLSSMANPQAAQQAANYAGQYGANAGNLMTQAGNAMAQGQIGSANAWAQGLQGASNQMMGAYGAYQQNRLYDNYLNPPTQIAPQYSGTQISGVPGSYSLMGGL